jgi:hypothetical protein
VVLIQALAAVHIKPVRAFSLLTGGVRSSDTSGNFYMTIELPQISCGGNRKLTRDSFQTPLNNDITPSRTGDPINGLELFQMAFTYVTLNYPIFASYNSSTENSHDVNNDSRRFGRSYNLSFIVGEG